MSPASAILPLAFVIVLSMTREGIEDYKKYKQDKGNFIKIYKKNMGILFI